MDDGLLVLDQAGRIVDLNPAAEDLLGRPASAMLRQPLSEALPAMSRALPTSLAVECRSEVEFDRGGSLRSYAVRRSPVHM